MPDEPLFNIGCRNAKGQNGISETKIVDEIYKNCFRTRKVLRVLPSSASLDEKSAMTYYGNLSLLIKKNNGFTTQDLLENGDGRCGAWTRLFMDVLRVQGIDSEIAHYFAPKSAVNNCESLFRAKHDNYGGKITSEWVFFVKKWTIDMNKPFEPRDDDGDLAQSNGNPLSYFRDHGVVKYNKKIYDPSYGSDVYENHIAWEDDAVVAYGIHILKTEPAIPNAEKFWIQRLDPKGKPDTLPFILKYDNINP